MGELMNMMENYHTTRTLLNNAICFMMEQNMAIEEIADYLGTTVDVLFNLGLIEEVM